MTSPAMHARWVNAVSLVAGTGITLGIFLTIAQFLRRQEASPVSSVVMEELEKVAIALPPPPPPPKKPEPTPMDAAPIDAIPLGLVEEPSSSPVKIPPSPPDFEKLLPMSQTPAQLVAGSFVADPSLKPTINATFDVDHVFQRSEVDKPPSVASRPDPEVRVSLLGDKGRRSVVVLFVVGTHGEVGNIRIVESSNEPEFDDIITQNIAQWSFFPAIKQGKPVRCLIQQRITVERPERDIFSL